MRADGIAPIQNKAGAFLADPSFYRILTNPERPINIRRIMDDGAPSIPFSAETLSPTSRASFNLEC
jgi:hypothetical protein